MSLGSNWPISLYNTYISINLQPCYAVPRLNYIGRIMYNILKILAWDIIGKE
jgi:hypothetical protein